MNKLNHPGLVPSPLRGGVQTPAYHPPNPTRQIQKGEQKANREPLRLETLLTHRKQNTGPTSNREKVALFQISISLPISGRQAGISSTRKPPREIEKHKIAPPIFVAIKNQPDPLFC
jgi:hypothetical protein